MKVKVVISLFVAATASVQVAVAAPITKGPNELLICTFNVYKLGSVDAKYRALEEDTDVTGDIPVRIRNLANVLAVGPFDLIVLQEVTEGIRGEWAVSDLVRDLNQRHGRHYSHFPSEGIGRGLMQEAIAFVYDPNTIQPQVLTGETSLTANIEIEGRDLARSQWRAGDFDFTLVAAHLAWGNEDDRDAGYEMIEDILKSPTPSTFSHDRDIIVLGDFNRFGNGYDSVKELAFVSSKFLAPNVTIFDPAFNTVEEAEDGSIAGTGITDPQLLSTTVSDNNTFVYDMILITNDVAEEFTAGTGQATFGTDFGIIHFDEPNGVGFQSGADALVGNALKKAYSDHRPLWMRFRTDTGNLDNTPSGPGSWDADVTYVGTQHGKRFHLPSCSAVRGRATPKKWTSRDQALSERGPCRRCKP